MDPLLGGVNALVSVGAGSHVYAPDVAYNPDDDQYLAVWLALINSDGQWLTRIAARRVAGDGTPDASALVLFAAQGSHTSTWDAPRAAYDPVSNQYLVVWGTGSAIRSRQVPTSGTSLGQGYVVYSAPALGKGLGNK